ncbi:MAG TPA: cytochrome c-type biogenesis protein CcmH [Candidatus Aquilonibacter sp.]|nr:cytochrome c-type biogenesis protein CcmH [Candidatus Aquilonibacter sp.]
MSKSNPPSETRTEAGTMKNVGAPGLASSARRPALSLSKGGNLLRKAAQTILLCAAIIALLGAGDPATRFSEIGHRMMCICGCNQILLECNHVGCPASDGMRNELMAAVNRGDSDSLVEQSFVQKYGPTVLAAPTMQGFDRAAYIIPFVALILGFGLIGIVIRSWKNRPVPAIADGLSPLGGPELDQFRTQARKETDL